MRGTVSPHKAHPAHGEGKRILYFRETVLSGSSNRSTMREGASIHLRGNKPVASRLGKALNNLCFNCECSISGLRM